jgi:GTPase SAR1 family protein
MFFVKIANSYALRDLCFVISGGKTPDVGSRTYTEIMKEQLLKGEETEVR